MTENNSQINIRTHADWQRDYYDIKDYRRLARDAEKRPASTQTPGELSQYWHTIQTRTRRILSHGIPDVEVACWSLEAQLRCQGIKGLIVGLKQLTDLIRDATLTLLPCHDNQEPHQALSPLTSLNGMEREGLLIIGLNQHRITAAEGRENFQLWQLKHAIETSDKTTLDHIKKAAEISGASYYRQLITNLSEAEQCYQHLVEVCTKRYGDQAPPSTFIKNALSAMQQDIKRIIPFSMESAACPKGTEAQMTSCSPSTSSAPLRNEIQLGRADIIMQIQQAADFFQQHEPHSPIPYLLARAIKWSELGFKELMEEVIQDDHIRHHVYHFTGIDNNAT